MKKVKFIILILSIVATILGLAVLIATDSQENPYREEKQADLNEWKKLLTARNIVEHPEYVESSAYRIIIEKWPEIQEIARAASTAQGYENLVRYKIPAAKIRYDTTAFYYNLEESQHSAAHNNSITLAGIGGGVLVIWVFAAVMTARRRRKAAVA